MSSPLPVLESAAPPRYSTLIGRPIDNTALSAYMRCPSEYHKSMVLHRRNDGIPSPSLGFGGTWHKALETHYKAAECSEADLIDQVITESSVHWVDHQIPDDYRTLDRLHLEYKKYLRKYGLPWREEFKTFGWFLNPLVEISGEIDLGARHPYAFKIDRIGKIQSQNFIEDHKTTSRFDKNYFRQYELDNQMMGYAASAELITGVTITGVRINLAVIHKNDSEFVQRTVSFSRPRLDDWKRNLDVWFGKIENSMEKLREYSVIAGGDAVAIQNKIDEAFPMNLWACNGRKYGSCQYVGVCSMPPHLRQRSLEDDFAVMPWNPLEADGEGEDA